MEDDKKWPGKLDVCLAEARSIIDQNDLVIEYKNLIKTLLHSKSSQS